MIRITRNDDIAFNVNEVRGKGDRYNITFYTVNNAVNIVKNDQDVTDGIITLNGSELMTIGDGVMNFRVDNIADNAGYNDGIYNSSFTRTTKYYISSGVVIPDGTDTESVIDLVSQLQNSISSEITRSTGKDTEHDAAIANVYTKAEVDEMLDDIDVTVTETDPTVPAWAKQSTKPTYTASEVGALPDDTVIPSKTSDLTNDSGFVTGSKIYVGTCTTAATTMPKVCTVEQFPTDNQGKPLLGTTIAVKFTNTNTSATNRGLDVNGTGSAQVYQNTAVTTNNSYYGTANRYIQYFWDGTNWVFLSWGYDANTTYTNVALGQGYATQSNTAASATITAALASYTLTANGIVSVKFNYDVPAGATLNINSKGAKAIYNKDAAITDGIIKAGDTATFIYSTYYRLISVDRWQDSTGGSGSEKTILNLSVDDDDEPIIKDMDDNTLTKEQFVNLMTDDTKDVLIKYDDKYFDHIERIYNEEDENDYYEIEISSVNSNNKAINQLYFEITLSDDYWYFNYSSVGIINGLGDLGWGYATQSNSSSSAITASLSNYKLVSGGFVVVYFTKAVSAGATLNIQSKGTKAIYYNGAPLKSNVINASCYATFVYHNNRYNLISVSAPQQRSNDYYNASSVYTAATESLRYTIASYGCYNMIAPSNVNIASVEINLYEPMTLTTEPIYTLLFDPSNIDLSGLTGDVEIFYEDDPITWDSGGQPVWQDFSEYRFLMIKVYNGKYATFKWWD